MNKKFTKLMAALALLTFLAVPMGMWGQTYSLTPDATSTGLTNTSYITSLAEFTYSDVSWKMNQWNPSTLQIKTNQSSAANEFRYYNTSALPGRITKVVMTFSALTVTDATKLMFLGGTSEVTATTGGTAGTWNSTAKTLTWTPGSNDNFTYFAFYQNGKAASGTNYLAATDAIVITYETSGGNTPTMSVSPSSIDFGSDNTINPEDPYTETFNVTFANLTQNLTVTGFSGVTVSPATINANATSPQTVTVSYNPTTAGSISGNISVNSSEVTEALVAVTGSAYDPANVDTYEKYTGAIVEGDYVIYANNYALKNTLNNEPRFNNESVTVTNNTITNPSASIIWHIAPIENTEYWTIYNADVQKYAGGTQTKNQGALLDEITDFAKWSIYYQTSILYIKNYGRSQGSDPNNCYIRQNGTNGWATYASGTGAAPQLYKKVIANQVARPTFSVAAGTYYETKSVELSCETTGATIYYTIDGTTPSVSNGTEYTTAISVSSSMTIKAIAVNDGMADSDVVSATYTIEQPYSTIAALFNDATSTVTDVTITFGGWVVSAVKNNNAYLTDNQGHGLIIYASDHGFQVNDVLTGTASCKLQLYNGSAELTTLTSSTTGLTVTHNGSVTEQAIAISELGGVNTGALLSFQGLTYNGSALVDGNNNTITPYNTLYSGTFENEKTYNVKGIYLQYNTTKEILPRSEADIVEVEPQHEDRTLTISTDSHVTEYFIFDEADQTESYTITNSTATIQDGTTVLVSLDIEDGYVVDEITVTYGSSQSSTITTVMANVEYTFTMPAANATLAVTTKVAPVVTTYTLVSSQAQLMPGKHYIIVGSNAGETEYYAMGEQTTAGSNKIRAAVAVTKSGTTTIQGTEDVCEFVISGDATNGWTFYDESANYYLKGINGNELDFSASLVAEYCYWTIDFSADAAELIQSIKYTDRYINFNNGVNPKRFANYKTTSNQRPVSIYVKDGDNDLELYSPTTLSSTNTITVPANGILTVKTNGSLTNTDAANLVIEDGGQLICNNAVVATVQKTITGHENSLGGGWNFIASPVAVSPSIAGLITDNDAQGNPTYDLYLYDEPAHFWRNYRNENFSLANGQGYLYANNGTVDLSFAGTIPASTADPTIAVTASASVDYLKGFNLVGNPFARNLSISDMKIVENGTATAIPAIYKSFGTVEVNGETRTVLAITEIDEVAPCEGFFIQTATAGTLHFNYSEQPAGTGSTQSQPLQSLEIEVKPAERGGSLLDRAYVNFGSGNAIDKFNLYDDVTKLYIPQNDREFALIFSEAQGELPVNFKAAEDGTYTITVSPEGVEMNYLHLIDNMTGMDIDLLQTPSYTFDATTRDYESRFRLVFGADNENGASGSATFAYFNGSEWQVSNEGEATLQVIDMMGRIVSTETVNGNCNLNLNQNAGVYMLRLINSNGVKTQKVVVR